MLKVAFRPEFVHPLSENHRFPMLKYELLPKQLLHEGTLTDEHFFIPEFISEQDLTAIHSYEYVHKLNELKLSPREERVTGFPLSVALVERERYIMEGTRKATEYALKHGAAMNIAGGTHHAYADHGEGFCLYNDFAIAAQWLLDQRGLRDILIIDLDVHQGNGTAAIFKENEAVYTFSMHGENNYPLKKENSDLDIPLKDGIGDKDYLYTLEKSLDQILKQRSPQFMFYQCGVDILGTDKLGKLNVTKKGCKTRDEIVVRTAKQLGIPLVCAMGGGYSPHIKDIVEAHATTFRVVQYEYF